MTDAESERQDLHPESSEARAMEIPRPGTPKYGANRIYEDEFDKAPVRPRSVEKVDDGWGDGVWAGQLVTGDWLAWIPYMEDGTNRDVEPMRSVSEAKLVAAADIQRYYKGEIDDGE